MNLQTKAEPLDSRSLEHPALPPVQTIFLAAGITAAILLSIATFTIADANLLIQLWIGLLLGYTLFHARFGFTSAFRRLMSVGNGEGLRAHMLMLAVASSLFAPILAYGASFYGHDPTGFVSPVGTSLLVGAFIFGIGMQLGGGCASGTLYSVGGGRSSMFITLFGFIAGSVIGAAHFDFWMNETPTLPAISLATDTGLGYGGAWLLQLVIFAGIIFLTYYIQRKKNPPKMALVPSAQGMKRIFRGSWPLLIAGVVLAVLNAVTLLVRGQPWGITSAFALWGSKAAQFIGIDVASWGYWSGERAQELNQSVFLDSTSVMNFGIMAGAFIAAAAGGVFVLKKIPPKVMIASLIGGIMMGYGARLAFGCNIGAYFSGVASFSLHGWVWAVMALAGTYFALYLRPLFGLSVPKPTDSSC
ncbi:YeeE/YedE family protein [Alkalihalophilus pseudofirmus]|uniref:YeeE/YedE family protein n=1 Tax=Alkalihalophilus pseudofirmus TaxID=79885 RepID=UPI00259AF50C|nr:YeeE/YedE family protein [Alkalihalophilus pseudofirmus]WEG15434.1 YeeE/YedE family protein [Alkalihalophilus pseudofirmus]